MSREQCGMARHGNGMARSEEAFQLRGARLDVSVGNAQQRDLRRHAEGANSDRCGGDFMTRLLRRPLPVME